MTSFAKLQFNKANRHAFHIFIYIYYPRITMLIELVMPHILTPHLPLVYHPNNFPEQLTFSFIR